ncbi:hypothetical protein PWF70_04265 [Gordonia sp. Swx-4]|nr:hypothetical protein [Gordonia sp. Swx-4]WJG14248.1 hypothetical protein PWF70_04265 [Gordonia sp. Swx-4]
MSHRGPGRAYWRYTPDAGHFSVQAEPVAVGEEEQWGRAQADADLDIENGPAWRLVVARTADDASVLVSLVISHVIADGGTGAVAVLEAVHGPGLHARHRSGPGVERRRRRRPALDRGEDRDPDGARE